MSKTNGTIRIGTSGWSYDHWEGPFYPEDLSSNERLDYYKGRFSTVEINNSFYHLPQAQTLAQWRDAVPDDFVFTAKASRYITHMKKLKDPRASVPNFLERIEALGDRLGPLLFQLPPRWRVNTQRLETFLEGIDERFRYAFEFRDTSWFTDDVCEILSRYGAAFCIFDLDGELSPLNVTTDFVYIRLHGPDGPYQGSYDDEQLAGWADQLIAWSREGRDIYVYFDNDEHGFAALNAARLQELCAPR